MFRRINNHGVVKTFTVRYKCCYGFTRTKGTSGCDKKLELKSILDTITDLKAQEFRNLIQNTGLDGTINDGNFTFFVPTDVGLNEFNEKTLELVRFFWVLCRFNLVFLQNNVDLKDDSRKNALSNNDLVLSHAVSGFVDLADLGNEDLIFR